ncbi:unnamed protein product [Alopecurus aequalis]
MKLVCRTELLTTKMVEDTSPAQDMADIAGHVVHEDASYDKDVVEIKLPDSVVSSDYGGNFVKDVCIDDGRPPPRKFSEEKVVDEKSSPKFYRMIDANGASRYGEKDCPPKSVHELKPEIVVPVGFAPGSNNEKRYPSHEEHDPEGKSKATNFADIREKKISLEELLRLESAEEAQHKGVVSSETSENHVPPLHGEAVGQVSTNSCHGIEAIASKTSELADNSLSSTHSNSTDECMVTMSEEPPESSSSAITDAASTEPICTLEKNDDVSAERFDKAEKAEPGVDAPSSSSSDIESSEKSNVQNESSAGEEITSSAVATTSTSSDVATTSTSSAVATTSPADNVEPSGANGENDEKHETDCITEQITPDSVKPTSRIGNGCPPFGPSIMSAPVSNSGHLAYSGSISIRSDSSTTSTRSFAFPVLQRDWISSPVRMAKGERRRARRRYGWRKGFLCCKF